MGYERAQLMARWPTVSACAGERRGAGEGDGSHLVVCESGRCRNAGLIDDYF